MAGMNGFSHLCNGKKVDIQNYKKTLRKSLFSYDQVEVIWDFYVSHSLAETGGQTISLEEYGWNLNARKKVFADIEKELMIIAGIDKLCCIRSNTIKDTLMACDLSNDKICIEHPRIVIQQKYSITVDENEIMKFSSSRENRLKCLFRHIRNSFAHANTYFFDNGYMLLEDKDNNKTTGMILIRQQTLLDWIGIIDKEQKFYVLHDVCNKCTAKEKNICQN